MRLLFCQLRNHGDIIRTFPLIDTIKAIHPEWTIGFTCYPEMVETCELCDNIDSIVPQTRFKPVTDTQGGTRILNCNILSEAIERVKQENYDVYIDLHGVFQSAVFGALCDIKTRLGRSKETSKDGASYFYTDICEIHDREINRMERHFTVVNRLFPEIRPIQKNSTSNNNCILIFPGSSSTGILKRWEKEKYFKIGTLLGENYKVRFLIVPEEQEMCNYFKENTNCELVTIFSWKQVEKEIEDSKLVIGNDGAYLHIAIWKGVPTVMLCGPTSPIINGVWKYGKGSTIGSFVKCECKNVWSGVCDKKHDCMNSISVEYVMKQIMKYV